MFCRGRYATTLISPSLGTRSSENILCFDEFMLRSVKTLNVLQEAHVKNMFFVERMELTKDNFEVMISIL